jgi:hypothetical protein
MSKTPLLCKLGLHKWGRPQGHHDFSSNVVDMKKRCLRCGIVKKWVEPYKDKRR